MQSKMIEATNVDAGGVNWGKFLVARFTHEEWSYRSAVDEGRSLLRAIGCSPDVLLVVDLQTGEGVMVKPGGNAAADLHRHRVAVCPMFEPFLTWLYQQDVTDLETLPALVQIDDPRSALYGYRRSGREP